MSDLPELGELPTLRGVEVVNALELGEPPAQPLQAVEGRAAAHLISGELLLQRRSS